MIKEINFAGVLFPPMLGHMLVAVVIWYVVRYALTRFGFYRYVWHPPLFNTALYLTLLGLLVTTTL